MTVAKLSVHLFGQLLFVYILLEDCSSSHCVALEGSHGQNRKGFKKKTTQILAFRVLVSA